MLLWDLAKLVLWGGGWDSMGNLLYPDLKALFCSPRSFFRSCPSSNRSRVLLTSESNGFLLGVGTGLEHLYLEVGEG